jgi:hypothetical protein
LGDNNQIGINTTGSFSSLYFYSSGTQKGGLYYTVSGEDFTLINNGTTGNIIFANNGAERARINSSGNLGLGVTPSAWASSRKAIQVGASGGEGVFASSSTYGFFGTNCYLNSAGNNIRVNAGYAQEYRQWNDGSHQWMTTGTSTAGSTITFTQAMTLDASGRLGIGTTNPSSVLVLNTASGENTTTYALAGSAKAYVGVAAGSGQIIDGSAANDFCVRSGSNILFSAGGQYEKARIDSSGNLDLTGGGTFAAIGVYNNTTASAANVHVSSAGGLFFRSTSALKYKQDIRDLEEMDISLLRPVRYKSKCEGDDQTKDHLGLIADEAAENGFEELVTRGANGEVEGFQYERLTVVLLKEIQSLRQRIATLEAK